VSCLSLCFSRLPAPVPILYFTDQAFASGISLTSSFSQFLLQALRQLLPSVFHMAMVCISQVCLEGASVNCSTLLQQSAQNDWMPAPDTIDPPSTMLALMAEQIGRMNERHFIAY